MKSVWGMAAGAVVTWLIVAALQPDVASAAFFGMSGPLAAVVVTGILAVRAARVSQARVTSLLLGAFFAKMLFFGAYVVVVLRVVGVDAQPFAVSFTAYFVALYAAEAVLLRRLSAPVVP
jgi:hypothetical protein